VKINKYLPAIYFLLGFVFSFLSLTFYPVARYLSYSLFNFSNVIGGTLVPYDGGSLGFAIIGSICFACSAYLTKINKM